MDLQSILDQVVAGVVVLAISGLFTWGYRLFFSKPMKLKEKRIFDPVLVFVFIDTLLVLITILGIYFSWQSYPYFVILSVLSVMGTVYAKNNQCPSCKSFNKTLESKDALREEERPFRYRDSKVTLYSDGEVKGREYYGPEKIIMEKWRLERDNYKCRKCNHRWSESFDRNLDEKNRPRPHMEKTSERNPETIF